MTTHGQPGLVIHVSSGATDDLRAGLRYAANFTAIEDARPVDIVVNGAALDLVLTGSDLHADVTDLADGGLVTFSACANTIRARGMDATDLHPAARIVPAAVAHIAQRQWAGWAYLRP